MNDVRMIDRRSRSGATQVRYRRALWDRRAALIGGTFVMLAQSLTLLPVPLLMRFAIDRAIPERSTSKLMIAAAVIVSLTFLNRISVLVSQFLIQTATKHATAVVREDIANVFFSTPYERLGDVNASTAQGRMIGNVDRIEEQFDTALRVFLPNLVMSVGMLVILFTMDPLLTVVCATVGPLILLTIKVFRPMLLDAVHAHQDAIDDLGRSTLLAVRAQALFRSRGTADLEHGRVNETIAAVTTASARRVNRNNTFLATQGTLLAVAAGATLAMGGQAVIAGRITLGSLLSFFAGFTLIRGPISALSSCTPKFVSGRLSGARVDEFIRDHQPESPKTQPAGRGAGELAMSGRFDSADGGVLRTLALEQVSFAYNGGEPIISDFSIHLRPGFVVGLCGPNGSGKSTVLGLLLGLIDPNEGRATANGCELHAFGLMTLRRQVGLAAQHPAFLPGSVRDNIAYGREDLAPGAVEQAIDEVEASGFIAALDRGVDTQLGDNAERLSGGERQRLALARAIVGRPPVVIFDEPNNHLPDATIERIVSRIMRWPQPPAVLLISHDRNVLNLSDEVLELTPRPVRLETAPSTRGELSS